MTKYAEAARVRGRAISADIERCVRGAMDTIEAEMKANGGIYPNNGAAVSMNEVARRAGIHPTTFHTAAQRELGRQVKAWVELLRSKAVVGRMRVRRTHVEQMNDWKSRYLDLQKSHQKTELDLQQAEAERDEALLEVEKLRETNVAILKSLDTRADARVAPIRGGGNNLR
jgi:hypothetical protein